MSESMILMILSGAWETLIMTFVSGFFAFLLGLPIGCLLFATGKSEILKSKKLNYTLSFIVNCFRAIPFIILIVWMIPFTRMLAGSSIGLKAAIVPLSLGAAPFVSRMVENSLIEVPAGLLEAARSMGASAFQIIYKVLLPEALPSLIKSATITLITLEGYAAMGGAVGAGGLGQIGYQYGYVGYNTIVMNTVLVLLICLVFLIQFIGDKISIIVDRRK